VGKESFAMIERGKHNLLGILVDAIDYEAVVARIVEAAKAESPLAVSAMAVHGVMTGVLDPVHRYRLNHFDLLVPDGQPVRMAINWLYGTGLSDRVYGPRLMLEICRRAAVEDLSVLLFGGTRELLERLRNNLCDRFPELKIAGALPSKFRRLSLLERDQLVSEIRGSGASIVFVGLGCPRQEVWAYEFHRSVSVPVVAVGAAFNFHAGLLPQAPPFFQENGLEWLFRLCQEPRRLWRRYLVLNHLFVALLLAQRFRLRVFDPQNAKAPLKEILYG
jgi:exopolysaccharide biosynthesis WecB/TagA/CpsF family protein